jgi:hypothetical protein
VPYVKKQRTFAPWRRDYVNGGWFMAASFAAVYAAISGGFGAVQFGLGPRLILFGSSGALFWLGSRLLRRASARAYGKKLEVEVYHLISRVAHKRLRVEHSCFGGKSWRDADVLIQDPESRRQWVIEVKASRNVAINRSLSSKQPALQIYSGRYKNAQELVIGQAKAVACDFGAQPILWFPNAFRYGWATINGALVVLGGTAEQLLKTARIPTSGSL